VEVTWDAASSGALTQEQRERLIARIGPVVRAVAEDTRSQSRNRELAIARLQAKVANALVVARARRPSRPSRAAIERRLAGKRRQSLRKQQRRVRPDRDDE
jgi:ribosome-associated protein